MFKKILSLSLCLSLLGIGTGPSFRAESPKSNSQSVSSSKKNEDEKLEFKDYNEKYEILSKKYENLKNQCEKLKQFNEKNDKGSIFSFKRLSKLVIRSLLAQQYLFFINSGKLSIISSLIYGVGLGTINELIGL